MYFFSAQNKSRLKWSILCHVLMTSALLVKLFPQILGKVQSGLTLDLSLLKVHSTLNIK